MTPKEATAVNVLLGYMVGKDEQPPKEVVLALLTNHFFLVHSSFNDVIKLFLILN